MFLIHLLLQLLLKKDFSKENMDKLGHGVYEPLDVNLLSPPHLIYVENLSDSGKVSHME
ncbi:Glucuronokinase [Arachis hypogaea]|nr:Glucuronokinase [Arachis hypogaea]